MFDNLNRRRWLTGWLAALAGGWLARSTASAQPPAPAPTPAPSPPLPHPVLPYTGNAFLHPFGWTGGVTTYIYDAGLGRIVYPPLKGNQTPPS
jgi:hypothetical protein